MNSNEIRKSFLEFFRERGHAIVPSAPVIPQNDPTLLFTNAGMNQFKPYFLGRQKPETTRVADTQKCIRVSGKHNDLEEVGPSPYHHTFFEMLGNWSFGDYFKKEAITWAWDLITRVYGLPKDKLYATVYETDDEAEKLWRGETDIEPSHVLRFGKKDNFWSMGDTGPCGPCSELHIDRGPEFDSDPNAFVNTGSPRYIELWNLVFIQFDAQADGKLLDLPAKHVDTGAGLERITAVMGNLKSNYETDLFQPLIQRVAEISGKPYLLDASGIPHRVIADHIRCLSFAIADGAMPSNEGRGYVLRRILRRAARFGRKLDVHEPFLHQLLPVLVDVMGDVFPEVKQRHVHIARVIQAEEEHFGKTLDRGLERFAEVVEQIRREKTTVIPGEEAFRLYDTFGFPLDLMQLMAREESLTVDETGFQKEMEKQKTRARKVGTFKEDEWDQAVDATYIIHGPTQFVGYDNLTARSLLQDIVFDKIHNLVRFAPKATPFYAESGGQISDIGHADFQYKSESNHRFAIRRIEIKGDAIVHIGIPISDDSLESLSGDGKRPISDFEVYLSVDSSHRIPTQYNHTSTHLLQKALRTVLGDHVHQQGSYVGPDYLRFDYTHFEKPTAAELSEIEKIVNDHIRENWPVTPKIMPLKQAQGLGAMALFGEKYGDEVRMIEIGDGETVISRELCGGCHVKRTGDIGVFVICAETSVAAGVRRIEARTGDRALHYLLERRNKVDELTALLHSEGSDPIEKLKKSLEEHRQLEKELETLRAEVAASAMHKLVDTAVAIGNTRLVAAEVSARSMDELKSMADALREELKSGIAVLAAAIDDKPALVVTLTPDLVKRGIDSVPIAKELAKLVGGGGGGRPHMATAGGRDPGGIRQVVEQAQAVLAKFIK
ncbi:MAG: alanine--tRNA ligase [bacterium]|nr:alanine--tRNA ligase [bacterium]